VLSNSTAYFSLWSCPFIHLVNDDPVLNSAYAKDGSDTSNSTLNLNIAHKKDATLSAFTWDGIPT